VPELPEVEAARRGIHEQLVGRRITNIDLRRPGLLISDHGLTIDLLRGETIDDTFRHGKYMVLQTEPMALVVHMKLTGQFVARGDGIPGFVAGHPVPAYDAELPHKSTHLVLEFEGDARLYFTDIRHFARIWLLPHDELRTYMEKLRLGPDLLSSEFTLDDLRSRLRRRNVGRIKPILLDQTTVAGLGNIYVDEVLWHAKVHPSRTAQSLTDEEIARIYEGIVKTMEIAVPEGGAKIKHSKALTDLGEFPFIHAREGLPCQHCGEPIIKTKVNNRGTYLCETCQVAPDVPLRCPV
jgi:formamidopyrimidine-DNA glycosylase